MALAIFDLDNTLLGGDSDHSWGVYLADNGYVDPEYYRRENQRFFEQYQAGNLDLEACLKFAFEPLRDNDMATLESWRQDFVHRVVEPMVLPKGLDLIAEHRRRGDTLMIITATNEFLAKPVAARLGVDNLIATIPEQKNGRFTGEATGTPCYQDGKVKRLQQWLEGRPHTLAGSTFYSDSLNDIPLLEKVDRAVATDPDNRLREVAMERGWEIISLRG